MLYASDYWHEHPAEIVEDIEILRNRNDLSDDEKRNIFRNNTIRFLRTRRGGSRNQGPFGAPTHLPQGRKP